MALPPKVRIEGLRELESSLRELSKGTARGALRRALVKAAEPMRAAAERNAPEDTGGLKRGIKIGTRIAKTRGSDPGGRAFASTMAAGGSRADAVRALRDARRAHGIGESFAEAFLGPVKSNKKNSIKAIVQEYGSVKQAAQPYMRPAYDSEALGVLRRIRGELVSEIGKSVRRVRARALRRSGR